MTPDQWARVTDLVGAALERTPEERPEFVAVSCSGDAAIQEEVRRLLALHDQASGFMNTPAWLKGAIPIRLPGPLGEPDEEALTPAALQPGETLAGHYEIQHELGRGGFGIVYAAFDRSAVQRTVALKVIRLAGNEPTELTELARRRFLEEVRIAASLSHSNIATVYEAGQSGDWVYMTQELAPGRNLRRILAEEGALPPQRATAIARQLCAALAHAHGRGVIHRDIKPGNIIVDAEDRAKVTDFGIAQPPQEDSPLSGTVGGTPGYMAPEQLRPARVDARADIFGVGCVLYEMLAGCRPYEGTATAETLRDLCPEPSRVREHLPRALDRIVTRAMREDPDERYSNIEQLHQDLVRCEESQRRWPAVIAAALLLAIGAVSYLRYRHRASALPPKETVVIADFINNGTDPALADTLEEALAAALGRSPALKVLSRDQVDEALLSLHRSSATAITEKVASEICRQVRGRAYVIGSITSLQFNYVLGLRAINCATGDSVPERQAYLDRRRSREQLVDLLNRQAARLSRELSESKALQAQKAEGKIPFFRRAAGIVPSLAAFVGLGGHRSGLRQGARTTTSLTLAVAPTTADFGSLFTLTASVRDRSGKPVTNGSVTFYDGSVALETVQVVANASAGFTPGTASLKTFLALLGANSLTAKYAKAGEVSASPAVVATVTGKYPTTTTFTYNERGNEDIAGLCTFSSTVIGAGPVVPSGDVAFMEPADGSLGGKVNFDTTSWSQTFALAQPVKGVLQPTMTELADLNGDGIPDLIVLDRYGATIRLGNGDGSFQSPSRIISPVDRGGMALGDFNADGRIDLAITSAGQIRVFLGKGDGTFTAHGSFDDGVGGSIKVGDFNGDGVLDLVAYHTGTIDLLLGNGDGNFRPAVKYPVSAISSMAVGDINRDGYSDLVVATAPHNLAVFLGNRDGSLHKGATYSMEYQPGSMLLADFRGKGDLDLVTAWGQCCEGNDTSLYILRGNGDGTFQPAYRILAGTDYLGLATGDFNRDGKLDLVVSDFGAPIVNVLLGRGDGTFSSASFYMVGLGPTLPAVADLNHDGRPDIAVANFNFGDVDILLNQVSQTVALYPAIVPRVGRQWLAARYLGDANFAPSTSPMRSFVGHRDAEYGLISPCPNSPR